jgi:hypothetical protein
MLFPHFSEDSKLEPSWDLLQFGVPTVIGFARLCSAAIAASHSTKPATDSLSPEAWGIALAAKDRGSIELRGNKYAFEAADRFLAVCVVIDDDRRLVFKNKSQPRQTMAFLEGFRQLCAAGLVIHHLMFDFSLTTAGFAFADRIERSSVQSLLDFAICEPI